MAAAGYDVQETVFTLHDLKTKFPKVDVTTVIQCNGNRREQRTPLFFFGTRSRSRACTHVRC